MIRRILLLCLLLVSVALSPLHAAQSVLIASGAGYKRPVAELAEAFTKKTGIRVEQIYGHMAGILSQARQSGQVAVIFGDLSYLEKVDTVAFAGFLPVGEGRLVLAWPKGAAVKSPSDLADPRFARIALPDAKAAIYGIAATEFLQRAGLEPNVRSRIQMVATVPQVSAYLVSGEVDAGFINLTEALGVRERIGGYLEIDRALYSPIRIVGGIVKGFEHQESVEALATFLKSDEAREILGKHGL